MRFLLDDPFDNNRSLALVPFWCSRFQRHRIFQVEKRLVVGEKDNGDALEGIDARHAQCFLLRGAQGLELIALFTLSLT